MKRTNNNTYFCKALGEEDSSCKDDKNHLCLGSGDGSDVPIKEIRYNYCYAHVGIKFYCINADTDMENVIIDPNG